MSRTLTHAEYEDHLRILAERRTRELRVMIVGLRKEIRNLKKELKLNGTRNDN